MPELFENELMPGLEAIMCSLSIVPCLSESRLKLTWVSLNSFALCHVHRYLAQFFFCALQWSLLVWQKILECLSLCESAVGSGLLPLGLSNAPLSNAHTLPTTTLASFKLIRKQRLKISSNLSRVGQFHCRKEMLRFFLEEMKHRLVFLGWGEAEFKLF